MVHGLCFSTSTGYTSDDDYLSAANAEADVLSLSPLSRKYFLSNQTGMPYTCLSSFFYLFSEFFIFLAGTFPLFNIVPCAGLVGSGTLLDFLGFLNLWNAYKNFTYVK